MPLKKAIAVIMIACFTLIVSGISVCAEEITPPMIETNTIAYPVNISETEENGYHIMVKTYALGPEEPPESIPTESFEKFGSTYTLSDILVKEVQMNEKMEHMEVIEINTVSNVMDDVMKQIAPTIEYENDGFAGELALDVSTITCTVAGYKTSSHEVKKTREYPHLSDSDLSLIPKSITEGGTSYQLADVVFQPQNSVNVDYESIPTSYTAIATYSATTSSKKVTGYVTTAEYKGTISRESTGQIIYTAIFIGDKVIIPTPEPTHLPEPTLTGDTNLTEQQPKQSEKRSGVLATLLIVLAVLIAMLAGAAAAYWFLSFNATVYCQNGKEYKKLSKIRINLKEPIIVLDKLAERADSHNYVIELTQKTFRTLAGREVLVKLGSQTVSHLVDETSEYLRYQFEADFTSSS